MYELAHLVNKQIKSTLIRAILIFLATSSLKRKNNYGK